MKIKTIDVNGKEWFDKINGNSYFSAQITINYGTKTAKSYALPFQYGYGSHYLEMSMKYLVDNKIFKNAENRQRLWQYCKDNNIVLRYNKQENCLKRDVVSFGQ